MTQAPRRLHWRDGSDPAVFLVCGLGSGFAPWAPGTFGSLLAVLLWWLLVAPLAWWLQLLVAAAVYLVGAWLVGRVQARYGVTDDSAIVVDEVVGQLLALLALPRELWPVLAAFVLFRLLDIWKPGPIRMLEQRLAGAAGVMADDVLAGVLAAAVIHVTLLVIAAV